MASSTVDRAYADVPAEKTRLLLDFRASHPYTTLEIDGIPWRYIACGQGDKTLLFLPGGFLKADMWFHTISGLEGTHRIVAPDSFTLQGTYDMDAVCRALLKILDAERVDKASAIGLSAGGGIAQLLLQEHPQRMENLVLSHCGVIEGRAETGKQLRRLLQMVRILPLFVIRLVLLKRTTGLIPLSSDWIAFHNAYFREASADITKEMYLGFFQSSIELRRRYVFKPEVVTSWPGEMLILSSRDDELTVQSLEKLQARYPRAQTHLFERGGHHTFMFFPETYTAVLNDFLQRL